MSQDRPGNVSERDKPTEKNGKSKRVIIGFLAIAVLIAAGFLLPVKDYLKAILVWAESLGAAGPVMVAVIYVPACIFFLPGSVITLGAGALFGLVQGTIAVSIGSTAGACAAFLVGRFLAREKIEKRVAGNEKFAAIDEAVGRSGFTIVFLTRLSPVFPFNLLNYAFGLTQVKFRDYALASWIGMFPGTLMYVYLGAAAGSLASAASDQTEQTSSQSFLFWIGLAATIAVAVWVTRIARQALSAATSSKSGSDNSPLSSPTEKNNTIGDSNGDHSS